MATSKKKSSAVTIELEVRTSRNSDEFEIRKFSGESYDAILEEVWDDVGMDMLSVDSACLLSGKAAEDRARMKREAEEAAKKAAEEAARKAAEKAAEKARRKALAELL